MACNDRIKVLRTTINKAKKEKDKDMSCQIAKQGYMDKKECLKFGGC